MTKDEAVAAVLAGKITTAQAVQRVGGVTIGDIIRAVNAARIARAEKIGRKHK